MRLFTIAIVLAACCSNASAQTRKFPYEAVIDADRAEVRSGPGQNFYATAALGQGTKVQVHRHDPGGWYMIAPPPGSFSWIAAEHVLLNPDGQSGLVASNNVLVFVGSDIGQSPEVWQRRLSKGESVRILGRQTTQTTRGPVEMFKIEPPPGEFRWIAAHSCTPLDQIIPDDETPDPFAPQGNITHATFGTLEGQKAVPVHQTAEKTIEQRVARRETGPALSKAANRPQDDNERLRALDAQLREIVQRDTAQWDFARLQQEYQELKNQTTDSTIARQVEGRFATLQRYEAIRAEYAEFLRLTSESDRRDAELAAALQQVQFEPPKVQPNGGGTQPPTTPPSIAPAPPAASPEEGVIVPAHPGPGAFAVPTPAPDLFFGRSDVPRFDGAGILQRAAVTVPGQPRYVLLAPNGQVLAYVDAFPGVELERYVGQSIGVYGKRHYRRDLQCQFLHAHAVTPVRLTP